MGLALVSNNVDYKSETRRKVKVKKDGNILQISESKNTGKKKGDKASPLKTVEEITSVIQYYEDKANDKTNTDTNRKIADRNKLLCIVGFNIGVRGSDLTKIRWSNVYDSDGSFLEPDNDEVDSDRTSTIIEKKTFKVKNLIFNNVVKDAFNEYAEKYDIDKTSNDFVFFSRQKSKNGEDYITVAMASNIIKEAVKAVGIKRRVASHTFRKTFAYFQMKAHQDDAMFTSELMDLLNHDSEEATLHYVGLDVERRIKYHNDVQLGKISKIKEHKKVEVNHQKEMIIDKSDLEYLFKQLSEKCYTCNGMNCETCYNGIIAKKYGYDLNTI